MGLSSIFYFKNKVKYEKIIAPLFLLACSFLVVAILTRDPLFTEYGIPPEFEWIIGFFIGLFFSWKYYFNPLKKRIMTLEKEVTGFQASTKASFEMIKDDLTLIKERLLK